MKIKILSILALLLTMTQGAWADDKADYGVLNGEFSVSAVKKVHFSRGNLRAFYYSSGSWGWYFPANQWDNVGYADGNKLINGNGTLSSDSHSVDLFCWSTNATYYGIHNSKENSTYNGSFKDWGTNAIANGGSKANIWYTPSQDEWTYLMSTRSTTTTNMPTGTNSGTARYTKATVASEAGLILFPDNYAHPNDASVTVSSAAYNNNNSGFGTFTVNAENWAKMEAAGAVFLPTAGWRSGTNEGGGAEDRGRYWLATSKGDDSAYSIFFGTASGTAANDYYRRFGRSVRLVIESHSITYNANGGEGSVDVLPKYTGLDRTLSDGTGLSRSGYILDGWATAADGAKVYDLGATYTEDADVTLYAHWTPVNDVTRDATMSEGWTISPANPVAAGAAVIATYSGSRHVKSVTYRPAGTIGGKFTVNNSGDKVYFSKGNLQLVGENSWKFADNQWDYFGDTQADNHRDLFGWGTGNNPNKTSEDNNDYDTFTDWGNNSFLQAQLGTGWYTLSNDDWHYLFKTRTVNGGTGAGHSYTLGQSVNGKMGVVIYPDNYAGALYTTGSDWSTFEAAGCVFLPAAGTRYGNGIGNTDKGYYWSSTPNFKFSSNAAYSVHISDQLYTENSPFYCSNGQSVRLVRPVVELSPNAEKTVWTLASMPAYDIELSAEYYDEVTLTDGEAITALNTYTGQEIWVNYTRSFTADKPSTVCLPFDYTKKTGDGSFYEFTGIEKVGSEYIATMTEPGTSTLTANRPYLYKSATTGATDFSGTYAIPASIEADTTTSGDWTFKGIYINYSWITAPAEPTYGFSAQDANDGITQGQFVKVGSYVRIKPMRAYLQYNGSDSQFTNARSLTRAAATTSDDTLPETIGVRLISANGEVTAIGTLYTRTGEVSFDSEAWYTLDGKRLNAKPNTKGIYVNNGKKVVIK